MKVDARTLLLAEQAQRDDGHHAMADLLRDTIRTINGYRFTLRLARIQIVAQRDTLIECHGIDGTIPADDKLGLAGLADLDAVLKRIDEVLE